MVLLYHYTDFEGAQGIISSGIIRTSTAANIDASFGIGVYLTAISPQMGKSRIIKNNYDNSRRIARNPSLGQRASYYFEINSSQLPGVQKVPTKKRDVWLFQSHIDLNHIVYAMGETDGGQELQTQYDSYGQVRQLMLLH